MQPINDKAVRVRIPGIILARATKEAGKRGMSLSEFMRSALRGKVGMH